MKKIFEYIGILSLVCFSFFLTEQTVSVVKEVDEIMIEIKNHCEEYGKEGENAKVFDQFIIPGLSSRTVNVEKSYQEMSKIGTYNEDYFVYDTKKPKINLDDYLDKYIPHGNSSKRMVSILLLVKSGDLALLKNKIGDTPISLVMKNSVFEEEAINIQDFLSSNIEFLIADSKEANATAMIQKLNTYQKSSRICYNPNQDSTMLKFCQKNNYYSIAPASIITSKPLQNTKRKLESGAFLTYQVNEKFIEEFPNILSYIESRGYQITSLSEHIKEI